MIQMYMLKPDLAFSHLHNHLITIVNQMVILCMGLGWMLSSVKYVVQAHRKVFITGVAKICFAHKILFTALVAMILHLLILDTLQQTMQTSH